MWLRRYLEWLHLGWPAGTVEKLPVVGENGQTAVPGLRVVGDLSGVPLLKLAVDGGARAIQAIRREAGFTPGAGGEGVVDVAIVGCGVAGVAAAIEARRAKLSYVVYEAAERFNTIASFPPRKPIFTYPSDLEPAGVLQLHATVKEDLLAELEEQRRYHGVSATRSHVTHVSRRGGLLELHHEGREAPTRAQRVVVAIGRSGSYRGLDVPGEELDKVTHRLYDPRDHAGRRALVVGGGDSAVETAVALARAGARVTLCHRGPELTRPKPENLARLRALLADPRAPVRIERPSSERESVATPSRPPADGASGTLELRLGTRVERIEPERVALVDAAGNHIELDNDVVFAMVGREAPLDFFRRSGVPIQGERGARFWLTLAAFLAFCLFLYNWKAGGALEALFRRHGWFPHGVPRALGLTAAAPGTALHVLAVSLAEPGFWYSLLYTLIVVVFGVRRVRRRRTPYVTAQTLSLAAIQVVPLFLLPYLILPLMGAAGAFDSGLGKLIADNLFPAVAYGHGREYWRAFGLIMAWPLFVWNVFSAQPMTWWLVISLVQTFVLIPAIVFVWGKGAYCGFLCSCGALAETLGDAQRHKMPHGPAVNRLNAAGQVILAFAFGLLLLRVVSWALPGAAAGRAAGALYTSALSGFRVGGVPLSYSHVVDLFLAGVIGVGLYFHFSGRVWCRFFCPLAALMHVYARLGRFRIFADKPKCISCSVCTSVCHQGIDVMAFAQKGLPMEDPQCVRCSACVQSCPTGVLSFGRVGAAGEPRLDRIEASTARLREARRALPVLD